MHSSVRFTKDERKKLHVHTFYDHTKGGVDVVDLIFSHQSTRFKSPRWPVNALYFCLTPFERIQLAEFSKPDAISIFKFTFRLGKKLLLPVIQRRFEINNGIQSSSLQKIERVLSIPNIHRPVGNVDESFGGCDIYFNKIVGTDNVKNLSNVKAQQQTKKKMPKNVSPFHVKLIYASFVLYA